MTSQRGLFRSHFLTTTEAGRSAPFLPAVSAVCVAACAGLSVAWSADPGRFLGAFELISLVLLVTCVLGTVALSILAHMVGGGDEARPHLAVAAWASAWALMMTLAAFLVGDTTATVGKVLVTLSAILCAYALTVVATTLPLLHFAAPQPDDVELDHDPTIHPQHWGAPAADERGDDTGELTYEHPTTSQRH